MTGTIAHLIDEAELRLAGRSPYHLPSPSGGFVPLSAGNAFAQRRALSAALRARGVTKGDRVAIIADTRIEWAIADLAVLAIGAVTVGVYPASTPEQMRHILAHARCNAVFVGGEGPRHALGSVLPQLDLVPLVVDLDDAPLAPAVAWAAFLVEGQGAPAAPATAEVAPDDVAAIVYTSGTTGEPKGVVLTHGALYSASRTGIEALNIGAGDTGVAFLPLAHVLARVNLYGTLHSGCEIWFSPSLEQVAEVWKSAHPTTISVVPRVLEKVRARILETVARAPARRRMLFARALEVGTARLRALEHGAPVPRAMAVEHALWERLVYRRVRAGLGWDRLRFVICGGAPLRREVAEFFGALGATVLEGYGLSETSAASVINLATRARLGSVGRPLPGVDLKIADDGEILIRGPGLFSRYQGDLEATRAAFDDGGYFRTGDVGHVDADGFLFITDRKKDLIVTAGGKNVAPQRVEAALLGDPRVAQAVVLGDDRPYLVALLALDPALGASPHTREHAAQQAVAAANAGLARFEQVKRWALLDRELTVESGLLTPTQKVKRRAVARHHAALVDALYARADDRATA